MPLTTFSSILPASTILAVMFNVARGNPLATPAYCFANCPHATAPTQSGFANRAIKGLLLISSAFLLLRGSVLVSQHTALKRAAIA